ncbi:hypothetical protein RYE99_00125 [Wolbachia endosymbiont of Drosophila seguyi]|nr:hypothetical protein [Wolbachia endosymbiont of Drosophila seguyi]
MKGALSLILPGLSTVVRRMKLADEKQLKLGILKRLGWSQGAKLPARQFKHGTPKMGHLPFLIQQRGKIPLYM